MGYSFFVILGMVVAFLLKRSEDRRLGYRARPGYRYVALGALLGAALGAKIGMLLYVPLGAWETMWSNLLALHFDGKTVLGGIAGGFVGVELTKKLAGVVGSTGDAFILPIAVGQGIGRFGCTVAGCCCGAPSNVPWAVEVHGALRHPAPLYDALSCFTLAAISVALRRWPLPSGHLFRWFLVAYALIRVALDPFRGDERVMAGPLSLPQWFCLTAAIGLTASLLRSGSRDRRPAEAPQM
jgi:phosphatidylglycerol---prolipoprotein diacylglyceryl transferase